MTRSRTASRFAAPLLALLALAIGAAPAVAAPATPTPTTGSHSTAGPHSPAVLHSTAGPRKTAASSTPSRSTPSSSTPSSSSTPAGTAAATGTTARAAAPTAPDLAGPRCSTHRNAAHPVICLPSGFGENQPAQLGAGSRTTFIAQVANDGPDVADASLVITVPAQLRVPSGADSVSRMDFTSDGSTALACVRATDGATLTCATGPLDSGDDALVLVDLVVQQSATPGTTTSFGVALQPVTPDTYPSTSVRPTVHFLGVAHLQLSLNPKSLTAVVGSTTTVTASIHNVGPDPAPDTLALGVAAPRRLRDPVHFRITNGRRASLAQIFKVLIGPGTGFAGGDGLVITPAAASGSAATAGSASADLQPSLADRTRAVAAAHLPRFVEWQVGTIPAGATATVRIRLKAVSVGKNLLGFFAGADAIDPNCSLDRPAGCQRLVIGHLTAVAAPAHQSGGDIAATGPGDVDTLVEAGLLALLVGCGLLLAGARRRPRARVPGCA